jgi:hypothetical protein
MGFTRLMFYSSCNPQLLCFCCAILLNIPSEGEVYLRREYDVDAFCGQQELTDMQWSVSCMVRCYCHTQVILIHGDQKGKTCHLPTLPTGCQSTHATTNLWYPNGKYTGLFYNNHMCCWFLNTAIVIKLLGYQPYNSKHYQYVIGKTLQQWLMFVLTFHYELCIWVCQHYMHMHSTHNITIVSDKPQQGQ